MLNYTVVFLIAHFLDLMIAAKMVGVFYEKRRTSFRVMFLSILLIYLISGFLHFFILNHLSRHWIILEISMFFVWYFIITLNYESTTVKRIVVAASVVIITLVSNIVAGSFIFLIFPSSIGSDRRDSLLMDSMVYLPIVYFMVKLLGRYKNLKNSVVPRISLAISSLVMLILLGYIFLSISVNYLGMNIDQLAVVLVGALFLTSVFLSFYLHDTLSAAYENKLKSALHAQEKEYYFAQCKLMQESVENAKSIRHDIKSQLATLKDYSTKGKPEDIENYLDGLLEDIERNEIYSNTGNIAFDSIINYKLRGAKKDNIKLDLSMFIPPIINVEVSDIVTILGNLLDNALEAVAKVNEKLIKLDIEFGRGGLFIKVENSFNGEIKYLEERTGEEKQLASLKGDDEHGYGFKNIRQSAEKYNGYMQLTHDDYVFSAVVFLYVGST